MPTTTLSDLNLGLDVAGVERALLAKRGACPPPGAEHGEQFWIGTSPEIFLTPYEELSAILRELAPQPGEKVVDLGAAYGRMGFVIEREFPGVEFVGYEAVEERVREARRVRPGLRLIHADLADPSFAPEEAEFYFLYDFGARAALEKALEDLRRIAARRPIRVVGRGRSSRDVIERGNPWLAGIRPPRHFANYSIYSS